MQNSPKPKLKAKVIPVFRVHYQDLERYIQEVYGFEYDFLFAAGCVSGMYPEYQVTGAIPTTMAKQATDLRRGQRTGNITLIFNLLAADGYIPMGRYVVDTRAQPEPTEVYRDLLLRTRDPLAAECRRFKEDHEGDLQLMERVKLMDQAAVEHLQRARRG